MSYGHAMALGFGALLSPTSLLLMLLGMLLGVFVGVIPGLGGAVLLTMLLPFLFTLTPVQGLSLMVAAHAAIYFSGSITAILLNTPGAPESAPTTIDGYPMAQQGKGARALGISAAATTLGGWIGFAALIAVIPIMSILITILKPQEYLLLAILAVILVGQLRAGSLTKGVLSGCFGFLMQFVGYDPITGVQRFSFGLLSLYNGFNIVVVALGLFAMGEMFRLFGEKGTMAKGINLTMSGKPGSRVMDGVRDVFSHGWLVLRSALIGVFVGIIPGIGGIAGNFIAYGQAVQTSRHPELFGTGIPEGIIAPEASSLSKEVGSYIPTLALGIPSTVGTAVMLGAMQILGLHPGPSMLTTHLPTVFTISWILAITSLFASVIGLLLAPWLSRVNRLEGAMIVPFVFVLGMIGAYASTTDMLQVTAIVAFGVVGLVMKRLNYSLPGAIIGFILGGVVQSNLYLTVNLGGIGALARQPIGLLLCATIAAVLILPSWKRIKRRLQEKQTVSGEALPTRKSQLMKYLNETTSSYLDLSFDILWVIFTLWYVSTATTYPATAALGPLAVGAVALVFSVIQLLTHLCPTVWQLAHRMGGLNGWKIQSAKLRLNNRNKTFGLRGMLRLPKKPESGVREVFAIGWACGLALAIYLFGFSVAGPAFIFVYFLVGYPRGLMMASLSSFSMWIFIVFLIQKGFALHLYGGVV